MFLNNISSLVTDDRLHYSLTHSNPNLTTGRNAMVNLAIRHSFITTKYDLNKSFALAPDPLVTLKYLLPLAKEMWWQIINWLFKSTQGTERQASTVFLLLPFQRTWWVLYTHASLWALQPFPHVFAALGWMLHRLQQSSRHVFISVYSTFGRRERRYSVIFPCMHSCSKHHNFLNIWKPCYTSNSICTKATLALELNAIPLNRMAWLHDSCKAHRLWSATTQLSSRSSLPERSDFTTWCKLLQVAWARVAVHSKSAAQQSSHILSALWKPLALWLWIRDQLNDHQSEMWSRVTL